VSYGEAKRSRNIRNGSARRHRRRGSHRVGKQRLFGRRHDPAAFARRARDSVTAVILGAFIIQGLQPGPLLYKEHLDVVYNVFSSMIVANIAMLIVVSSAFASS
jgi:putative tricarboxylic transport membrane protein